MFERKLFVAILLVLIIPLVVGCTTPTPEIVEVTTPPEVVTMVVKETVVVEGTPQVIEKEVTKVVEVTREVEVEKSKFGGTLTIGALSQPDSLNPFKTASATAKWVTNLLYPPLLTINDQAQMVPYLATEVQVSQDAKQVTFKLREGVQWDDGMPITSEDVKFTAELLIEKQLGFVSTKLNDVESIDTPDPTTVVFNLKNPSAVFANGAGFWMRIVPAHIWGEVDDIANFPNEDPVGGGPFKLTKWEKGQYLELVPQGETWLAPEGTPYLDIVRFRIFPDMNTMMLALKKGEIDAIADMLPAASVADMKASDGIEIFTIPSLGFCQFTFHFHGPNSGPITENAVRQAMAMSLNKEAIHTVIMQGYGENIVAGVSPVQGELVNPDIEDWPYDLDAAAQKLEDAGYTVGSDGVRSGPQGRLEFTIVFDQGVDAIAKSTKLWADDLEQIGVKLNLKGTDRNTYVALGQDPNEYDIYVSNWGTMEDPMNYWVPDFGSSSCETPGTSNHSCINDPTIDQLAIDITRTTDKTAQLAKLYEMQEYVHEVVPALFVWTENQNFAVSNKWDGWKLLPSINNSFLSPGSLSSVYQVEK